MLKRLDRLVGRWNTEGNLVGSDEKNIGGETTFRRLPPGAQKAELERTRQVVRRAVPDAEEATSYGMPAFKYKKRPLLGFEASKNHLSVVPFSPEAVGAARGELAGFDLSKGTARSRPRSPSPNPSDRAPPSEPRKLRATKSDGLARLAGLT